MHSAQLLLPVLVSVVSLVACAGGPSGSPSPAAPVTSAAPSTTAPASAAAPASASAPAATTVAAHPLPPPPASASAAPALPAAPGACGFIEAEIAGQKVRFEAQQRFEIVDPKTGAAPSVHLDAANTDQASRWRGIYLGGDGAIDKKSRLKLSIPAKKPTGPNMGIEELGGEGVKVTVSKLGAPGEHVIGTFKATVKIDGKDTSLKGSFDVCRLPDRSGP